MKLLLAFLISVAQAGWVTGQIHVRDDNSKSPIAIFINSYTDAGPLAGNWYSIDVTTLGIPKTAKSVFLSGILIITHGTTPGLCDLTVAFRAPGDSLDPGNYIGQTIEPWVGGGSRSTMSTWAPVKNGLVEFQWNRSTSGLWPLNCSYGINLSAQAYVE